jgi:hypothetical protein
MPIIGLTFKGFSGKRGDEKITSDIKVNSSPKVFDLKEVSVSAIGKKAISMQFDFTTSYTPKIGEIKIEGELLYMAEKNKEVLEEWQKGERLPEDISMEVFNYLFKRCLLKVANIAEDLQLPAPIPFPKIKQKESDEKEK